MKRRIIRILLSVALGLAVLSGGIWVLTRTLADSENHYHGKSLYDWTLLTKSQNTTEATQARLVLNEEIIPSLTKTMLMDTNDSRLRMLLVQTLNGLPGIYIYANTSASRRAEAAAAFGEFGPAAEKAAPVLLQALQGQDLPVRGPAGISLGQIHAKPEFVVPLLIGYLENPDLQEAAVDALGEYGSLSKSAVPKLVQLHKVPDKSLRHAVEKALKNIDPDQATQAGIHLN